jgi:hypothetical protein
MPYCLALPTPDPRAGHAVQQESCSGPCGLAVLAWGGFTSSGDLWHRPEGRWSLAQGEGDRGAGAMIKPGTAVQRNSGFAPGFPYPADACSWPEAGIGSREKTPLQPGNALWTAHMSRYGEQATVWS